MAKANKLVRFLDWLYVKRHYCAPILTAGYFFREVYFSNRQLDDLLGVFKSLYFKKKKTKE